MKSRFREEVQEGQDPLKIAVAASFLTTGEWA